MAEAAIVVAGALASAAGQWLPGGLLLAVNLNFVAFSRYLDDMAGQVFVFFILTVAAAEAAIGLAILVVVFRNRRTINVAELDQMRG